MKISDLGEFGLIDRIRKLAPRTSSSTLVGIGDDAALLKLSASHALLATTDMLLEGVHFDPAYTDFYSLGWKSAAVNLSDIAAMGGVPRYCLTALGIPARTTVKQVAEFYRGFNALLKRYATELVGGDTCSSRTGLVVSVTVLGEGDPRRTVTRAGAKPGDGIFVTGAVGDSAAGLELLKSGATSRKSGAGSKKKAALRTPLTALIRRHLRPTPRVAEGRKLALAGCAGAMIDLSDGLSSDLARICEQSGVGAEIVADRIPLSPALRGMNGELEGPLLRYALSGGEDYELLFTVPPAKRKKLLSLRLPITEIGSITTGGTAALVDRRGRKTKLSPSGYDHFRRAGKPIRRIT